MFSIKNAHVEFYDYSTTIAYILASINDQPLQTLIRLGRGKMYRSVSTNALRYDLPNSLTVMLRTD